MVHLNKYCEIRCNSQDLSHIRIFIFLRRESNKIEWKKDTDELKASLVLALSKACSMQVRLYALLLLFLLIKQVENRVNSQMFRHPLFLQPPAAGWSSSLATFLLLPLFLCKNYFAKSNIWHDTTRIRCLDIMWLFLPLGFSF